MSRRSSIECLLPIDQRKELDRRLQESCFSNYTQHTQWLNEQGYDVTRSALHRYGKKLAQTNDQEEQKLLDVFRQLNAHDRYTLRRQAQILLVLAGEEKKYRLKCSDGLKAARYSGFREAPIPGSRCKNHKPFFKDSKAISNSRFSAPGCSRPLPLMGR